MAQTPIAASQTDADSPIDQKLMDALRTNNDDLVTRMASVEAGRGLHESILTDFAVAALDTDDWDSSTGNGGTLTFENSVLVFHLAVTGSSFCGIGGSTKRMRPTDGLDQEFICEFRMKESGTAPTDFFYGMQDASLGISAGASDGIRTTADVVGFIKGTNAGTYKFKISKTAVGSSTTDNLGNRANYSVFTIVATRSTTWSIAVTIDGVTISGSPFTSNMPAVALRPYFGLWTSGAAGTADVRMDYNYDYWTIRPAA